MSRVVPDDNYAVAMMLMSVPGIWGLAATWHYAPADWRFVPLMVTYLVTWMLLTALVAAIIDKYWN